MAAVVVTGVADPSSRSKTLTTGRAMRHACVVTSDDWEAFERELPYPYLAGLHDGWLISAGEWLPTSVAVPVPEPLPSGSTCWHYTSTSGVMGILDTGRLWASSVRMLNDASELIYGLKVLKEAFEVVRAECESRRKVADFLDEVARWVFSKAALADVYVACASQRSDDLGQWRGYGGSVPYAIEFEVDALSPNVSEGQAPTQLLLNFLAWRRVIYEPADQMKLASSVWHYVADLTPARERDGSLPSSRQISAHRDSALFAILMTLPYLKHAAFKSEEEVRAAVVLHDEHTVQRRFRESRFGVTPYIELGRRKLDPRSTLPLATPPEPLTIRSVMIGPCEDRLAAMVGVRTMLETLPYGAPDVSISSAPYR